MSLIRAMLLLCITILISVGAVMFSHYKKDRFEIIPLHDGVFIFDRQTTASNFCNNSKCIVISSEFLIPKKVLVAEIPGVTTKTQMQIENPSAQGGMKAEQQDLVSPSFNQSRMAGQNYSNRMRQNPGIQPQNTQQAPDNFNNFGNDNGQNSQNNNDNGQDNNMSDNGEEQDQGNNFQN